MLARKYRPSVVRGPDRPGRDGAHPVQRLRARPHPPGLHADGRARRRQDHHGAHPGAGLQLPDRHGEADDPHAGARGALPGDHREPPRRRDRDGRGQPHRHRRRARDHRFQPLPPGDGAHQDLHHRRGAHALQAGLQRPAEDAGGAAGPREVPVRHDRDREGAGDGALAHPALRPAPGRAAGDGGAPRPHLRQGGRARRGGGAGRHRPRRGGLGARRALAARPGHRARGRRGRHAGCRHPAHDAGPGRPHPGDRPLRSRR